jgi:iron complex transport system substrate-binding protein
MSAPARRIASLQPSVTVTLRDVGRLHLLVACTKYCLDVCPELQGLSVDIVADSWTAQSKQIVASKPDLVIASVPYQEKSLAEILKCGIPVLALAPKNLSDVYRDIELIAEVAGERSRGIGVVEHMRGEIAAVSNATRKLEKRKVFCEEWGKPLIASQAWVAELVEAAGGKFLGTPGAQTEAEAVRKAEPEIMIAAWCGAGDRVPLEKIVEQRNWRDTPAASNRRVACIRDEYLNTPASTLIQGLKALAAAIHPEQFPQAEGLRWIGTPR